MAPKGTFIVRSNRMTEPKAEGSAEIKAEHTKEILEGGVEGDNTGTSDESESIDDSKVEVALPMNDNESEEIDCVSLNSQCIRESLEGNTEIPCDIV